VSRHDAARLGVELVEARAVRSQLVHETFEDRGDLLVNTLGRHGREAGRELAEKLGETRFRQGPGAF